MRRPLEREGEGGVEESKHRDEADVAKCHP
jgi:hypothetical protein